MQAKIEDLLRRRNELLEHDGSGGGGATAGGEAAADGSSEYEARIADAHRKMDTTRKKFEKMRTVCISAEQVRALLALVCAVRIIHAQLQKSASAFPAIGATRCPVQAVLSCSPFS